MVSKESSTIYGTNRPPRAVFGGQEQTGSDQLSLSVVDTSQATLAEDGQYQSKNSRPIKQARLQYTERNGGNLRTHYFLIIWFSISFARELTLLAYILVIVLLWRSIQTWRFWAFASLPGTVHLQHVVDRRMRASRNHCCRWDGWLPRIHLCKIEDPAWRP